MSRLLFPLLALFALAVFASADEKSDWDILGRKSAPPVQRKQAAKSLVDAARKAGTCEKVANGMIAIALDSETYPEIKVAISEAIVACDCDGVRKLIAKKIGKGRAEDRTWYLQTASGFAAPEIDKMVLEKGLTDDKLENRADAAAILVQHKVPGTREAFEAILRAGKDTQLFGGIITHISTLTQGGADWSEWETRLVGYATDKNDDVRRAALAALAQDKNPAHIELFKAQAASADWSTRALVLEYLENIRTKDGLGAIVAQLANEPRGTRMNAECVSALMRLSGMNFADRAEDWAGWWQKNEAAFELSKPTVGPRTPRPKGYESGTKVVQFYGIEVESKRVCFIIDISGSMREKMKGGEDDGLERIDVAKRELGKIIDALQPGTLFNIVTFNSDVEAWLDQVGDVPVGLGGKKAELDKRSNPSTGGTNAPEKDEKQRQKDAEAQKKLDDLLRAKAHKYVDKLEAEGGTNIHDALERAFKDEHLDTIFLLTDGEPSFGREVDPVRIREAVQRWNVTRKIKLSTISIGKDFDLLKWLAEDSGGENRYFP
ncbi:MAG: HEAT repeat domain-containing protein [Planctomycetes bacterium]|nr:HEAT repeat domain-containing protein [Planctomycetota bacterium]